MQLPASKRHRLPSCGVPECEGGLHEHLEPLAGWEIKPIPAPLELRHHTTIPPRSALRFDRSPPTIRIPARPPMSLRFPIVLVLSLVCLVVPAWADFEAGMDANTRGDYATALREWRPLAEQGDALAQYNLGVR